MPVEAESAQLRVRIGHPSNGAHSNNMAVPNHSHVGGGGGGSGGGGGGFTKHLMLRNECSGRLLQIVPTLRGGSEINARGEQHLHQLPNKLGKD